MNSNLDNTFKTPWISRAYVALPGNPFWIGSAFALGLLAIFFIGRMLVDGASQSNPDDLRVAIIQVLLMAYAASAYAHALISARKTTHDLMPGDNHSSVWSVAVDRAGRHPRVVLLLVGATSYLVLGVFITNVTTPEPANPWDWRGWNYDLYWHRATTVFFVWWTGCFCHVVVTESLRLSRLSDSLKPVDLLELEPYQPLVRQGLTNALLIIGMVSVMSLLGVEARYGPVLMGFWISFIALAWVGMMLPLRGIRRQIKVAKLRELDWCRQAQIIARDDLKSDSSGQRSIAAVMAYKTLLENIRHWPFDNPTLVRFTLYLMIPLGSWLGGAFVERGLDRFLS